MSEEEKRPERIEFEDELRRYARAEPFIPFEVVVSSGERYLISESLQFAMTDDTVVTVLPKSGIRFFRKDQVVAVHVLEPAR